MELQSEVHVVSFTVEFEKIMWLFYLIVLL